LKIIQLMKRQTALFFYILGIYVVLQFAWWGFHLIQITNELQAVNGKASNKAIMIVGEGIVFFSILIFGLWRIKISIKKDQQLSERQSNFLLSVTHELKTPLASTKLYLQTLIKRDFSTEKREEMLQKAIIENQRLEEIVESILTATRLENRTLKLHKEWINLNDLIQQLIDNYNITLGKEWIRFENEVPVKVEADAFMIKTILRNLIENALKYAAKSDALIVYLKRDEQRIKFGTKDSGPGIQTDLQKDIFKKFFRIENEETRSQKGTGLGLFIASEFTKLHGGKLSYSPNKPKGSIFEITL
jgi:signal transduction histidine kinase